MTGIVLRSGAATHVGRLRTVNEDAYVLLPDRALFVVADGMGGHQGGDVASKLAIETLQVAYHEPTADALEEAILVANHRIRYEGDTDPNLRGMGTTVVALALVPEQPDPDAPDAEDRSPDHLVIANVGDSRAYLFRDGSLVQLTEDHSVVADLVRDGRITVEEAEVHPQRNIVTRVLGVYESIDVDLWPVDPVVGDRVLLCSDGLFNEVGTDQITSALRRLDDPSEAAAELVRLANEGGGRDNITVVLVDVVDDGGVARSASEALAGDASGLESAPRHRSDDDDLAGFTTGMSAITAEGRSGELSDEELKSVRTGRPSRAERRAERKKGPRTRFTWRVLVFLLLLIAVIGGALATIQWYGTSTYYVTFEQDEVAIYRGRPGGVLWVDPELEATTGIHRADVPARYVAGIEGGAEFASLDEANAYIANIERDIEELEEAETRSTTTTTRPAPTTSTTTGTTTTQAN
ncbi:MAG: Stp1/IreP family PP2C-type Ser/Thr phosphatase [Acidimicrobiales bacterium]